MQGWIAKLDNNQQRLAAIALCCLIATLGWRVPTVVAILATMMFVAWTQASERKVKPEDAPADQMADSQTADNAPCDPAEPVARDRPRVTQRHSATGIPTREPLIVRMTEDGGGVLGIISFVDFDRLTAFDPALGNRLLVEATSRLSAMLPPNRMLAHVDRAQLAIWFGADVDMASAQIEIDAITYALGEPLPVGGRPVLPEVKVHLTVLQDEDPSMVLARTLARLAIADDEPAASAHLVDPGRSAKDRFALEQDLRRAVSAGELQLRYQPLIDAKSSRVCGAEALLRWQHPQRGMIAPSRFIPLLESAGLAHEIGLWALNTACREARAWKTAELQDVRIAVNVSAYQLERDDLPTLVARTLDRHSLPSDYLEIELTESAALVDCDRARTLFANLRDQGVRIAIDDFGTGYSSLSTLRSLSFDKIKIDREFVTQVEDRKDSQAICQSIIALARGLGINVLAEGVERAEEYLWLRRHGCHLFQGYFFSPPLEGQAFMAFVRDRELLESKLAHDPRALQQSIAERLTA